MSTSPRPTTVLIDGGGFGNKGAEAMLLVVVTALRSRNPATRIYVRIRPHQFADARRHGLIPVSNVTPRNPVVRLLKKFRTALLYFSCQVRIDIGGYQFGDSWGVGTAQGAARLCAHFRRAGKRTVFMPQAWGPFTLPGLTTAIRSILDACDCAYVRDRTSLAAVEAVVGRDHPHVRQALDIAWHFKIPSLEIGRRLITSTGLQDPGARKTVCLTPNLRVYERAEGTGQNNAYIQTLVRLIEHICARGDRQVVLMGHALVDETQKPADPTDDRTLCRLIMQALPAGRPVAHLDRYLSAEEIKSTIGNCHQLVSSRYHALIAAFSQAIPAAAIGWSHKYDELMQDVALPANILRTDTGWEDLARQADAFMDARDAQAAHLQNVLPAIREDSARPIQHLLDVVFGTGTIQRN
jgi:polysaccharide pyruvyl transferase WcaK-like protein